jgi:hypothetical protein
MKARLPVLSQRPEPSSRGTAPAQRATDPGAEVERVTAGRILVCVSDVDAPELALRFAVRLIEALRTRGRDVAVAWVAGDGEVPAGSAHRIRQLGIDALFVLNEGALPEAALSGFAALPNDCFVVALGARIAARFAPLLSVRLSKTLPLKAHAASDGSPSGAAKIDLELGPSMEGAATLIGDWLACIPAVSSSAVQAGRVHAAHE